MSEDDRTEEQILKDNLIAQLADKGVTADRRYSVAKLQEMLGNTVLEVPVNDEPGPEPEAEAEAAPEAPAPAQEATPAAEAAPDKVAQLEALVAQLMAANQRQQQQLSEVRLSLPDDVKESLKAEAKRSMRPVTIRITKKGHNKVHTGEGNARFEWNDETTVPEYVGLELEERGFAEIV